MIKRNRNLKLLVLGPLPPPIGGCAVSFCDFCTHLRKRNDVSLTVINTSLVGKSPLQQAFTIFVAFFRLLIFSPSSDVIGLFTTNKRLLLSSRVVLFFGRVFHTPVIIRKFGGPDHRRREPDFKKIDLQYSRNVASVLTRCNLYLAQTKESVAIAKKEGIKSATWFPNSRPTRGDVDVSKKSSCRRFVYVGQVRKTKGVFEIIEVGQKLPDDVVIDVYGPLYPDIPESAFRGLSQVRYRGVLAPGTVTNTLMEYDVLLLPTYHGGEGYPGVILEAFSVGVPVIATRWRAIPEIVDENCGILISPRDIDGLYEAMMRLVNQPHYFRSLTEFAYRKSFDFSSLKWCQFYVDRCRECIESAGR